MICVQRSEPSLLAACLKLEDLGLVRRQKKTVTYGVLIFWEGDHEGAAILQTEDELSSIRKQS